MGDWFDIGGSAIGAIGSIGGGMLGTSQSTDGFSKKGAAEQALFEYFGAPMRAKTLLRFSKEAGLHPLAVIGTGAQAQPVIAGQAGDNTSIGYGVSEAFKGIGQDITNARMRQQTEDMRDLELISKAQQIDNDVKYGELLTEQIRNIRNPPAPVPETGDNNMGDNPYGTGVIQKKAEIISGENGAQHGSNPSEAYFSRREPKTGKVIHFRAKGEKFTEATEEDFMANLAHNIHQGVVVLTGNFVPPYNPPTHIELEPGNVWKWNTTFPYQGWYQAPSLETHMKRQRKKGIDYYRKGGKYFPPPEKYH